MLLRADVEKEIIVDWYDVWGDHLSPYEKPFEGHF